MSEQSLTFDEIHKDYCDFIDSCSKFNCYTRSVDIQKDKITECEEYLIKIKGYKYQAAERQNEFAANQFFHMQCMTNAMRSSLNMWIQLKSHQFEDSWSSLIDAQEYISIAIRINDYEGVRTFQSRLKDAEHALFPGWNLFNSSGLIETVGNCSICGNPFSSCEHIENEIYMGSLCKRIDIKIIRVDHCALVENPRDKRCIITTTSDKDGNEIDYFTWERTGKIINNDDGRHISGRVFCFSNLDVF